MQVIVQGYGYTKPTAINVTSETTIHNLKKKIQEDTGQSFDYVALRFGGKKISGSNNSNNDKKKTLQSLGIHKNARLYITGKMGRGGTRKNRNRRNMTRRRR